MNRVTVTILALTFMTGPALLEAQAPRMEQRPGAMAPAGGGAGEHLLTHRDALGLSVDQVAQIRRIQAQLEEQNRPLAEQLRAAMQQRDDITRDQRADMRERMQQLTPEQRAEMQQQRAQMRQRAQVQQRAQMRQRADSAGTRRAPVRGPAPAMRRPAAAGMGAQLPEELRPVMEEVRQNTARATEQLMAILTPDQRATLRTLRAVR